MHHNIFVWRGLLCSFAATLMLLSAHLCNAQWGHAVPGSETWGGYVIPDVNRKLSLASLLYNRSVAESLGVNAEGRKLIHDYLVKNGGSFGTKVISFPGNIPKTREEIDAETQAHLEKSQAFLDELISPGQWERLRQMAYQVEVGRKGLAGALTQGRLGDDSGVHGQQTDAIQRRAEKADAKVKPEILRILARMQAEVLAELTAAQQEKAKQLLGEPFVFKEERRGSLRAFGGSVPGTESAEGYVIPDVDNKLSLAALLYNRSVAQSLGLSADDIKLIHEYLAQNGGSFQLKAIDHSGRTRRTADEIQAEVEAHRTRSAKFLDEFMSPSKWSRLRQMAYQAEVARLGLAKALTEGKLSADIGVEGPQVELIQRKAEEAEARAKADIVKALMKMQAEVLAELTPAQRKEAERLLGDPIVFQEELESSLRMEMPDFVKAEIEGE